LKSFTAPARLAGSAPTNCRSARILQLLEVAERPADMNLAGFHFHGLQGRPKRWSARVTRNYRITFGWDGESAIDIDYEDYH
jgi:proteic killer suppression protein